MRERLLYASENGDSWSLARDPNAGQVFVRHRACLPSGGEVSDISLGAFLVQGGFGPEKQELLRLIGGLIESARDDDSDDLTPRGLDQVADRTQPTIRRRNVMPKGQQKSNKEVKKPKKDKAAPAAPASFAKAISESNSTPKKKS